MMNQEELLYAINGPISKSSTHISQTITPIINHLTRCNNYLKNQHEQNKEVYAAIVLNDLNPANSGSLNILNTLKSLESFLNSSLSSYKKAEIKISMEGKTKASLILKNLNTCIILIKELHKLCFEVRVQLYDHDGYIIQSEAQRKDIDTGYEAIDNYQNAFLNYGGSREKSIRGQLEIFKMEIKQLAI